MLNSLRRMFSRGPAAGDPSVLQAWAQQRGCEFRRVRDGEGCVIDGRQGTQAWRIEWGPSQRDYIDGFELRLLAELDLPKSLQAMVLNRQLMDATEKAVYEQFVDDVKTRMDTEVPPEMRWLVTYARLGAQDLGRLSGRYGAVCSLLPWLQQWLASPLNDALAATLDRVPLEQPVVIAISRGRLVLRTAMRKPDLDALVLWHSVFEHALREARRLGTDWREAAVAGQNTLPSAWQQSELVPAGQPPGDEPTR